jgi:hypothetical protein
MNIHIYIYIYIYIHAQTYIHTQVDSFFFDFYDIREPKADGQADKCFISKSYDATSHFEQVCPGPGPPLSLPPTLQVSAAPGLAAAGQPGADGAVSGAQ